MPNLQSLDSGLYRQRHRLMPALPQTRGDIVIPELYSKTTTGEQFLLFQSANNNIIIFCSPSNLGHLSRADTISMDGTFDAVPALYAQMFSLHAFEHGKLLPLAYCLLSSKARTSYAEVFQILKDKVLKLGLVLAPATIMSLW